MFFKRKTKEKQITKQDFCNQNLNNKELGKLGEKFAEQYLTSLGYEIIERNYKGGNFEVDLIAKHAGYIVFIEVKTRRTKHYGMPSEAVSKKKQFAYKMVASVYQKNKKIQDALIRFDIVEILDGEPNLIVNAFC